MTSEEMAETDQRDRLDVYVSKGGSEYNAYWVPRETESAFTYRQLLVSDDEVIKSRKSAPIEFDEFSFESIPREDIPQCIHDHWSANRELIT